MNLRKLFTINTWWGKLIGTVFGYLAAGSIGALLGMLIGNFFDRGLSRHFSNPHWFYFSEKRKAVQKIFFDATFSIMGHIAKADGRVSEQELNMALTLMDEMRLSAEQKNLAKHLFNEGKSPQFNLNQMLFELQKSCNDNRDLLRLFIDIQYRAAQIDGLTIKKIQVLDLIFSRLGFAPFHQQFRFYENFGSNYSQEKQQQAKQQYSSSDSSSNPYRAPPRKTNLDQAYALIEVTPKSSKQEVKRAYRRLLSRNHPDKLIAQGLPQEMIKIANEKTQNIMKAYELICSSKGW